MEEHVLGIAFLECRARDPFAIRSERNQLDGKAVFGRAWVGLGQAQVYGLISGPHRFGRGCHKRLGPAS